jgi:dihydropteroate synthase
MPSSAQKFKSLLENSTPSSPIWMGILNITPDSFSDGGQFFSKENALKRAKELIEAGAHILDIGAASTRPGAKRLSAKEEIERLKDLLPSVAHLCHSANVLISLDSYNPQTYEHFAPKGYLDIVNDVFCGKLEGPIERPTTFHIASYYKLGLIVMHMKGTPSSMQESPAYEDCGSEVLSFLKDHLQKALDLGVMKEAICLDPGIGFGKRMIADNIVLLEESFLKRLRDLHPYTLVGLSRKSFLGALYPFLNQEHLAQKDLMSKIHEFKIAKQVTVIRSHKMPCEICLP